MTPREEEMIDAAIRVLQRYGIKRTTMSDIAEEAGVSRQTLYTVYSSKDDVLRGAVRLLADRALEAVEAGCAVADTLGQRLDVLFEELVLAPFRLMATAPEASDIVLGLNEVCAEELHRSGERYRQAIEAILEPQGSSIIDAGLTVERLADYLQVATSALKKQAKTEARLTALLATLKRLVLNLVEGDAR